MGKKVAGRPSTEIEDYIARVEHAALSYGINHHHSKWDQPRPHSRTLYLLGQMLLPKAVYGLPIEVALVGDIPKLDEPEPNSLQQSVGHLQKRGLKDLIRAYEFNPDEWEITIADPN